MKIKTVNILDYKSILNITLEIEKDITCLIGTIGAGKTSILEAIDKIDLKKLFYDRDLPNFGENNKRDSLQAKEIFKDKISQLKIKFKCENIDKNWLPSMLKNINEIYFERYLDKNKWDVQVVPFIDIELKKEKFQRFTTKIRSIINELEKLQTQNIEQQQDIKSKFNIIKQRIEPIYHIDENWSDIKNNIEQNNSNPDLKPEIDTKINELEKWIKQMVDHRSKEPKYVLYDNIPKPIYLKGVPQIEKLEHIENIINNSANDTFTAIKNICKLDINHLKSIQYADVDIQNNYFTKQSEILTEEFNEIFKMDYVFKLVLKQTSDGDAISLTVIDPITKTEIDVTKRSEGLQWILGFYFQMVNLTATVSSVTHKILLLDNPAIPIHDLSKERIREYIKGISKDENLQILYTTHERALVDATNIQKIRFIKKTKKGTENILKHDRLSYRAELARHIGSPGRYGLFGIPFTIFVEGMSDVNILIGFNELAQKVNKDHLELNLYAFDNIDGAENIGYNAKLYKNFEMPCCFIIDDDRMHLKEKYSATNDYILSIQKFTIGSKNNSTIEDLFTMDAYKKLLIEVSEENSIDEVNNNNKTILNAFEKIMEKNHISKINIAKSFRKNINQLWDEPSNQKLFKESLDNYVKLVKEVKTIFNKMEKEIHTF